MRVYLYEMVSGGGAFLPSSVTREDSCLAELDDFHQVPSLITDGSRMLEQLVRLFLNLPDFEVWISVDSRLKSFGQRLQSITNTVGDSPMVLFADPTTPWAVFEECCRGADRTILVAPELANLLETAVAKCLIAGGSFFGADRKLRKLGIDKIALHRWAEEHHVEMPAWGTSVDGVMIREVDSTNAICKPVMGTGGVGVRWLHGDLPRIGTWLIERVVPGKAVSVAAILTSEGPVLLPPCYQSLGGEFGFEFQDGTVVKDPVHIERAWRLADEVFSELPLEASRGWIGLDLILGEGPGKDVLIEVNPRITSTIENLASLAEFVPYQCDKSTNVSELMLAAAVGK
jgi:predicted ATP-grasp superfamily ATP-dependent carboligase